MLDANVLIRLLDIDQRVVERVGQCLAGDLCISAIAYAEVVRGMSTGTPAPDDRLQRSVEVIPVMPFDDIAAHHYAMLPFKRHRFDRLIGSHALALGLTLVTANPRDFADVPDLKVENWTR